jgi:hypothetical protein
MRTDESAHWLLIVQQLVCFAARLDRCLAPRRGRKRFLLLKHDGRHGQLMPSSSYLRAETHPYVTSIGELTGASISEWG